MTNLIGIQWFTRESIVSRHGMARGDNEVLNRRYKRKWNAAMNESANWKTLFFSLFPLSLAVEILILLHDLVPSTCQRCACRCKKRVFFLCFSCYVDISTDILLDIEFNSCILGASCPEDIIESVLVNCILRRVRQVHRAKWNIRSVSSRRIKLEINLLSIAERPRIFPAPWEIGATHKHTIIHVNVIK